VQVSAAPVQPARQPAPIKQDKPPRSPARLYSFVGIGAVALFLLTAFAPTELIGHLFVFALAIVIGYYVIGNVHHALHTPLLSVTNAISGIIVVGALLQIGHGDTTITVLSFVAILLASINVFGGFTVTRRMLAMFTRADLR
jgi:NAD(P) transhydrogenase subunit alpha